MNNTRPKQLEAALAFILVLLIVSRITKFNPLVSYAIIIGFLLGTFPFLLRYFYIGWTSLLNAINFITSRVILTLIFILLVLPLSFWVKKSKKRTIILDKSNRTSSFEQRAHLFSAQDFENPW